MSYISLRESALTEKTETPEKKARNRMERIKKVLGHPIRVRILEILSGGESRTQRELGKALFMSNAAVHYHLKTLCEVGFVQLEGTRPGPKGITEKLYTANPKEWQAVLDSPEADTDLGFYLDYTMSWMRERHREGIELLKTGDHISPFIAGSYTIRASEEDLIELNRSVKGLFDDFFREHKKLRSKGLLEFAVTFSVLPAQANQVEESLNILEFEPGDGVASRG